ncbi:MAG: hypothetical protein WBW00_11355, partial [Pseudolabrys sp.]
SRRVGFIDARRFRKLPLARESLSAPFPDDPSIVIGDREGRQVFNSSRPVGEPLPPRTVRGNGDEVFRTLSRSFPNSSPDPCRTGRS